MQSITSYVYDARNRMVKADIVKTKNNDREVISYSYDKFVLCIENKFEGTNWYN